MTMPITPTPYADVNLLLDELLTRLRAMLGEQLVGLYLYGSLATGDFHPTSSDIDFVAATVAALAEEDVAALRRLHEEIARTGGAWTARLEGAYIPLAALRRDEPHQRVPHFSADTPFAVSALGDDWIINRYILREHGVVVFGPPPATLIDPIAPERLARAVQASCREWSAYLAGPAVMRTRHYQAFAILTLCRALYALERGELVSKPVAARWAESALEPEWAPLIQRALAWRHDETPDDAALGETLRFLRVALARTQASAFTPLELAYLLGQRIGRLATLGPAGAPHVVPVGFRYNSALDAIDLPGTGMGTSKKYRDVGRDGRVAFVVDDRSPDGHPRGIEIRGHAEALPTGGQDIRANADPQMIRLTPTHIAAWGIDGDPYRPVGRRV